MLEMSPELTRERRIELTKDLHDSIELSSIELNSREIKFMSTVKKYVDKEWALTDKQLKWLKDIHKKYVVSPNSSEESQEEEEC